MGLLTFRLRPRDALPLVAAAAIPLVFLHARYQAHASIGPVGVYGSDVAIAIVVGCAIWSGFRYGWQPLAPARLLWIVAGVLLLLFVVSCFWHPLEHTTKHLITAAKIIEYALLAPSLALLFRRPADVERFLAVFVAWAGAAALWGALMFFAIVDDPEGPRPGQREVSFLGHQDFGSFTGCALAIGLAAIAFGTRKRLAVAGAIGGAVGVILDASVFVYLGTVFAAIAIVVVARKLGELTPRRFLTLLAIMAVIGAGVLGLRGGDVSNYLSFLGITPASASADSQVQTGSQRAMLLWIGWHMWENHPILGLGFQRSNSDFGPYLAAAKRRFPSQPPEAFPSAAHPWGVQNLPVELLADTGVVGFALGAALFLVGLLLAFRQAWKRSFFGLVAACFVLVAAGTWNAIGIVAGIPLEAVTWLGLGLAATAAALEATRASSGASVGLTR